MKKTTTALALLSVACSAAAETNCSNNLSGYGDSHVFRVKEPMNLLETGQAKEMILKAIKRLCKKDEIQFDVLACNQIVPDNASSVVCYAETNIGYFFVHNDMINTTTVTWNRYD